MAYYRTSTRTYRIISAAAQKPNPNPCGPGSVPLCSVGRDRQYRDTCIGDTYRAILLYRYRFSYFSKYRVSVSLNSYFTYRRYKLYSDVIYRDGQYRDTCIGDTYRAILLYRYRYRFSYFSKYRVSVSL